MRHCPPPRFRRLEGFGGWHCAPHTDHDKRDMSLHQAPERSAITRPGLRLPLHNALVPSRARRGMPQHAGLMSLMHSRAAVDTTENRSIRCSVPVAAISGPQPGEPAKPCADNAAEARTLRPWQEWKPQQRTVLAAGTLELVPVNGAERMLRIWTPAGVYAAPATNALMHMASNGSRSGYTLRNPFRLSIPNSPS